MKMRSVPPPSTVVEIAPAPTIDISWLIVIAPSASAYIPAGISTVAPDVPFAAVTAWRSEHAEGQEPVLGSAVVFTMIADGTAGAVLLDRLGLMSEACAAVARKPASAVTTIHASSATIKRVILRTDLVNEGLTVCISPDSFRVKCDNGELAVRMTLGDRANDADGIEIVSRPCLIAGIVDRQPARAR
jgi:hypothetical protein